MYDGIPIFFKYVYLEISFVGEKGGAQHELKQVTCYICIRVNISLIHLLLDIYNV